MNCPRCSQPVDEGAAFCGNCGQTLTAPFGPPTTSPAQPQAAAQPPVAPPAQTPVPPQPPVVQPAAQNPNVPQYNNPGNQASDQNIPSYAVAHPGNRGGETKAIVAMVLGIVGIPAGMLIPILGFVLAIVGVVLATIVHGRLAKKTIGNLAIGFSSLAIAASVGGFLYYAAHPVNNKSDDTTASQSTKSSNANADDATTSQAASTQVMQMIETPCYKVGLPKFTSLEKADGSCTLKTYDAPAIADAKIMYAINATTNDTFTQANFTDTIKAVAAQSLASAAPGFTVTSQKAGTFAESPAYIVDAKSPTAGTVQMQMIFHPTTHGENVFILVVANNDPNKPVDTSSLATDWKWL